MSLEAREYGRTFEEILRDEYGGNLKHFCSKFNFTQTQYSRVASFLMGKCSKAHVQGSLKEIAAFFGERVEDLFPDSLYCKTFATLKEAPGYQVLQKKFGLIPCGTSQASLFSLFRGRGFTRTEYSLFVNLARGNMGLDNNVLFIRRLAESFEVPVDDLFPPHIYSSLQPQRLKRSNGSLPIQDCPEAAPILSAAAYAPIDAEGCTSDIRSLVAEALSAMTKKQRVAFRARYLSGVADTPLRDIGSQLGSAYQNVQSLLAHGARRVRDRAPHLQERWAALRKAMDEQNNHIVGVRSGGPTELPSDLPHTS